MLRKYLFFSIATRTSRAYRLPLHDALPILAANSSVRLSASIAWTAPNCAIGLPETTRSEEHTSELQSLRHLVCRLLLEKKKQYVAAAEAFLRGIERRIEVGLKPDNGWVAYV